MIKTDFHSHILPAMDDGAGDLSISLEMLKSMRSQGIKTVAATPHFYPHREASVNDFLRRRAESFSQIQNSEEWQKNSPDIILGAEVAVERGLSEKSDLRKLAIQGTELLLLELPFTNCGRWVADELYEIKCETGLKPMLAHIHRYIGLYSRSDMEEILTLGAVCQVNAEAFDNFTEKRFVRKLMKSGTEITFGSDAHNMTKRPPDYRRLARSLSNDAMAASDEMLVTYSKCPREKV